MENELLISNSIKLAAEEFKRVKKEISDEDKCQKKQLAQAEYFNVPKEEVENLKIDNLNASGVNFKNISYCIKKFIQEEAIEPKVTNLERRSYDPPAAYPITSQLEIELDVFVEIWTQATVFFKWKNEPYSVSIDPCKYNESHDVYIAAKDWESLRSFTKAFREYKRVNHYLRGKKFIGIQGELMRISHYDWNDIVLDDGLGRRIKSEVEGVIRCSKELNRYGLNSKKGFILAGDPGNGKTLLLKILANTLPITCIMVPFNKSREELRMAGIFRLARELAPTMLMLEDIDLYGEDRESSRDAERLGELMNELDGMIDNKEIIVFATTNNLLKVEKALQSRPGRFDRVYKIINPDFNGRLKILQHFVKKVPNEVSESNVSRLAEDFEGYSGAYLKELINSGFAQAVLRDAQNPILYYSDLEETSEVLKNKDAKRFLGFAVSPSPVVGVMAKAQGERNETTR